jgi:hypothetical protein
MLKRFFVRLRESGIAILVSLFASTVFLSSLWSARDAGTTPFDVINILIVPVLPGIAALLTHHMERISGCRNAADREHKEGFNAQRDFRRVSSKPVELILEIR